MNLNLARYIIEAVDRYWAEDVQILGAWQDEPAAVCVVYRRTIDPMMTLGCRLEFHANSADGIIEGFARDVAVNLAEPIGIQITTSREDQNGIVWVAVPEDRPRPRRPPQSYKSAPIGKCFLRHPRSPARIPQRAMVLQTALTL